VLDGAIVGVGRYESIPGTGTVEVAFVVRDDLQGLGLGRALVELIAEAAAAHGKTELLAETLPENQPMRRALHHAGTVTSTFRDGLVEVRVPLVAGAQR
jgi:GNAT superfamily N-acetyltransferase